MIQLRAWKEQLGYVPIIGQCGLIIVGSASGVVVEPLLVGLIAAVASAATSLALTPRLARLLLSKGISGQDIHKPDRAVVAEMGGISVVAASLIGWAVCAALGPEDAVLPIASSAACVGLVALVGALDDLRGLRQRNKVILTALAAAPIIAINSLSTAVYFPGAGLVGADIIYPLILAGQ